MEKWRFPERLRGKEKLFGTLVVSDSPLWPAVVAETGADFTFIDMEHIPIERPQVSTMCQLYRGVGIPAIVRIPTQEPYLARNILDAGAAGIIAPYVETAEQVEGLIGAVKKRPIQGDALQRILQDGVYPSDAVREYAAARCAEHALILNIESVKAVEQLEMILSYEEVDAVLIGPHDLSCSLGIPEQYDDTRFLDAVDYIITTARAAGKGAGYHKGYAGPGIAYERELIDKGMNLIIHEADILILKEHLAREISYLRTGNQDARLYSHERSI